MKMLRTKKDLDKLSKYEKALEIIGIVPERITEYKIYNDIWEQFQGQKVRILVIKEEE